MVRLVEHHQIPGFGLLQQDRRAIPSPHQVARRDHRRLPVPEVRAGPDPMPSLQRRRGVPDELAAVVDGPVEVELLAELDLPLSEDRLGRQDEDAFRAAREPRLTQQQPGLDGLAEPHLVGDQQPGRPVPVEPFERLDLVRPGGDRRGRLPGADAAVRQRGRAGDEGPDAASQIPGRRPRGHGLRLPGRGRRILRGGFGGCPTGPLKAGRRIVVRHEAHEVPAGRVGHVEHDHPLRPVRPDACEVALLLGDPVRLRTPARVDVDALPVVPPAGGGLVEAAVPGEPVAGPVRDDARLLVEDAVGRDRSSVGSAGHGDLHLQMAVRDHPGEQFQRFGRGRVGRGQGEARHVLPDPVAEFLAALDRLDLGRFQRAAHDEPHPPVVAHQTLDAACGECERPGVEISRQPVVALGILQRGHVEERNEVAVLGRVFEPPCAVGEHGVSPRRRATV